MGLQSGLSAFVMSAMVLSVFPALAASSGASGADATVVSDFENATPSNALGGFWYFFDDRTDSGQSRITTADTLMNGFDSTTIVAGAEGSVGAAKMGFRLGAKSPICGTACTYPPQVGMGTQLAGTLGLDIRGATAITFRARADAPIKVTFTLGTADIVDNGNFAKSVSVGTGWTLHRISLEPGKDLAQPSWARKVTLDLEKTVGFGWTVSQADNPGLKEGAFYLDDVVIEGWKPVEEPTGLARRAPAAGPDRWMSGAESRIAIPADFRGRGGVALITDARGRTLLRRSFAPGAESLPLGPGLQASDVRYLRFLSR